MVGTIHNSMLKNVEQTHYIERHPKPIAMSFKRLADTFKNIKEYKTVFMFLIAYFFYIDGVDTIITMSTAYGTISALVQRIY